MLLIILHGMLYFLLLLLLLSIYNLCCSIYEKFWLCDIHIAVNPFLCFMLYHRLSVHLLYGVTDKDGQDICIRLCCIHFKKCDMYLSCILSCT
jgi:hypothetical protein